MSPDPLKSMGDRIEGPARKLLEEPNYAFLATLLEDGSVNLVPTWVDVEDGLVVLNTLEGRLWPENVRRDPRVTLTVADRENPYEWVQIRGRVVEDTPDGADEHADRQSEMYLGQSPYPSRRPGDRRVIFRVRPEKVVYYNPQSE